MKAEIVYQMRRMADPFDENKSTDLVFCLVKVTRPEFGQEVHEPVAAFHYNSEAVNFEGHVLSCEASGRSVIVLDDDEIRVLKELHSNEIG